LELDTLPDLDSETPLHSVGTSDDDGPAIDVETGLPLNVVSNIPPSQQETQDADVLAEADIYILYGRYREAEALLREELERAPQRADLKYKLGEALIGSGNRSALAALLDEMRAAADDTADPAKWASLENGLAGLAADAVDGEEPAAPPPRIKPLDGVPVSVGSEQAWSGGFASTNDVIGETGDTDLGFSVREVTPSSAERLREQMADLELDLQEMDAFDGGLDSTQGSEGASTPPVPADDLADIGQSAAPLHIDPPALPSPAPLASPKKADAPPDDRLDLDLDGLEELTASPVDPVPPDLTLPVPEAAPDTAEPPAQRGTATRDTRTPLRDPLATTTLVRAPDAADESAAGGGPLEDSISSDVLSSQWRMDSGLWDEAATKMDLARAYLEMEDPDAARAILAEVVQEGSEEQRADAAAILAKIG
jgi:pilus assembly protein FimV